MNKRPGWREVMIAVVGGGIMLLALAALSAVMVKALFRPEVVNTIAEMLGRE